MHVNMEEHIAETGSQHEAKLGAGLGRPFPLGRHWSPECCPSETCKILDATFYLMSRLWRGQPMRAPVPVCLDRFGFCFHSYLGTIPFITFENVLSSRDVHGMEKTGIPWVRLDSHWNWHKISNGMGMG